TAATEIYHLSLHDALPIFTFLFEFCDRAAIRFLQYAVNDGLLHLGTELSDCAEIFPPCRQRPRELLHEMLDPACTTAQMEQEIWTHQAPTQSRSPAHGRVRVSDIQNTLFDEVHDFTVESRLKPVRDMANHFLSHADRLFADRSVERDRSLNSFWGSFRASDDLDQRNNVRRIKRVTNHAPFGILAGRLHHAHGQTG